MKAEIKDPTLKKLLSRTPEGREIIKAITLSGNYEEYLGKGFWKKVGKGLKKAAKSVGKVTRPITTRVAKIGAGLIGIPPGAIDALAKVDPTAKNSLLRKIASSKAGQQAAVVMDKADSATGGPLANIKPVYMIAGAGTIAAIVFFVASKKGK